jgi:hypothetical protein
MDNRVTVAEVFLIAATVIIVAAISYNFGRSSIKREEIQALRDAFKRTE